MKMERDDAKIGLLVLLSLGLFLGFLFQRSLTAMLRKEFHLQIMLANASDVTEGTEVQLQGLRVGQVEAVRIRRQGVEYRFLVRLGLRNDIVLWEGTQAVIVTKPLGGANVDLQLPPPAARRQALAPDTILTGARGPTLGTLLEGVDSLVRNLDLTVTEVRVQFEQRGAGVVLDQPQVSAVLRNLQATLQAFELLAKGSQGLVVHGDQTMTGVDRSLASLGKSLAEVQKVLEDRTGGIDQIAQNLGSTLKEIQVLGRELNTLLADSGPAAQSIIKALDRNLNASEELLEILKAKPNRLVFGTPSDAERAAATQRVQDARKAQGNTKAP